MAPAARSPSAPVATAGVVVWRRTAADIEILLVHPGGPFWAKKDEHAWSIPKGEFDPGTETPQAAAHREFVEELAQPVPAGDVIEIESFRAGKKRLYAFAIEGDVDITLIGPDDTNRSTVELEWPPRSGQTQLFPEVDRAAWVALDNAATKLHKGQAPLVERLREALAKR